MTSYPNSRTKQYQTMSENGWRQHSPRQIKSALNIYMARNIFDDIFL